MINIFLIKYKNIFIFIHFSTITYDLQQDQF